MKDLSKRKSPQAEGARIAIVASKYHAYYVNGMLQSAKMILRESGILSNDLLIIRVPGAFEISAVISKLASRKGEDRLDVIIALGVIFQGETPHAKHIGEALSHTFADISRTHQIPIIHEVLLLSNPEQARKRCLSKDENRGVEAANTALEMAKVMRSI